MSVVMEEVQICKKCRRVRKTKNFVWMTWKANDGEKLPDNTERVVCHECSSGKLKRNKR